MKICFWNIQKNNKMQGTEFDSFLDDLLKERDIDLFCVSEYELFNDSVLLNNGYVMVDIVTCDKVKCYKKKNLTFTQIRMGDRYVFIEDKKNNALLVCIHAYDAIHYKEDKRLLNMEEIKREIDLYVKGKSNTSVFIFGDFNCMPYSESIINKDVLNCVLFRDLINVKTGAKERYYNPMLLLMSEDGKKYGSYYNDSIDINLRWYLLDQVIVNKYADKIINYDTIELIKENKSNSLMKNGKPDDTLYSDHLPLFFEY